MHHDEAIAALKEDLGLSELPAVFHGDVRPLAIGTASALIERYGLTPKQVRQTLSGNVSAAVKSKSMLGHTLATLLFLSRRVPRTLTAGGNVKQHWDDQELVEHWSFPRHHRTATNRLSDVMCGDK